MNEREEAMVRLLAYFRKLGGVLRKTQAFEHDPEGKSVKIKIWLSGNTNSGKSTLRRNLAELLGFNDFYVGDVFREKARIKGLSISQFYAEIGPEEEMAIDREWIALMLEKPRIIIEGRMAPWVDEVSAKLELSLRGWEETLRISLFLSVDPLEGAKRALGRKENAGRNMGDVVVENESRKEEEQKHYSALYGISNHLNKKATRGGERVFDYVIDTTNQSPEAVLKMAHGCIAHRVQYFFRVGS